MEPPVLEPKEISTLARTRNLLQTQVCRPRIDRNNAAEKPDCFLLAAESERNQSVSGNAAHH